MAEGSWEREREAFFFLRLVLGQNIHYRVSFLKDKSKSLAKTQRVERDPHTGKGNPAHPTLV